MMADIARELVTPKFVIFYLYLSAVLYLHLRSKVRMPFLRQMIHHSGLCAPYNALMYMFSAVSSKPILDVAQFPQLAPLRANWQVFRDEAQALYEQGQIRTAEKHNDLVFVNFYQRGWKRFYLKWYEDFLPSAKALCPRSVELVRSIPDVNAAAFTLLPPGGTLGKHRDPLAGALRYHLGLVTPNSDKCRIWIDGEPYSWRDGQDIVFDETYMHWARNDTDQARIILFCDVTRPLRTPVMRALSRFMNRYVFKITRSANEVTEKVGLLNRITPAIGKIRTLQQRAKKINRTAYYVVKHALILVLVYLVFVQGFLR